MLTDAAYEMTFAEIAYVVTGAAAFGSWTYVFGRAFYFSGPEPTAKMQVIAAMAFDIVIHVAFDKLAVEIT